MNILITGVAGFIGSNLAARFLKEGHTVFGIDNFITGQKLNVDRLCKMKGFDFIEHDATNPIKINDSIDWIMHFASPASPPKYLKFPIETLRVNSEGTFNLLNLAMEKNAKFFLASTSEVYGDALVHPQPETYWGNVNPNGERSVYDEAKRYAEAITFGMHRKYNIPIRVIRIFNTYGPYMDINDGRVVTNFLGQVIRKEPITVYGDGSQTRSFQYIDDLVEGIIRLMSVEYYKPVNLGNPEEFTIMELVNVIKELTKNESTIVYRDLPQDDPQQRKPDISCASNILKWKPKIMLKDGISSTFEHFIEISKKR